MSIIKLPLSLLTIVISANCYSQILYEEGYYINSADQKINCLIKNIDWKNNPTGFTYKRTKNSKPEKATIKSVKEFGVFNTSKYVRVVLNVDRSSDNVNDLSRYKKPIFKEEELFLKVLVEGKSNLYEYVDGNLKRYFYKEENSSIEQLVFKRYRTSQNNIGSNTRFRQQLWNEMKCPSFDIDRIQRIGYNKNDLVKFFVEYTQCNKGESVNYGKKPKKDLFNLTLRPRLNNSSLTIRNSSRDSRNTDFGNEIGLGAGIEAEFILPFNKNKWSIIVEPTYQYFNSKKPTNNIDEFRGNLVADVNYKSIEFPVGLRQYFFLNDKSKFFVNASYLIDLSFNSSITITSENGSELDPVEIDSRNNLAFGVGYKYNDKYSFEINYQTNREILSNYALWSSNYQKLSVVLGYSIF